MIGIEIEERLSREVKENVDKRLLYVEKIILKNDEDDKQVKDCMNLLKDKALFYQFNDGGKNVEDCDYFFYQYCPFDEDNWKWETERANWHEVDITVYNKGIDYDYKMRKLIDFIRFNMSGVNLKIIIEYGDVRDLLKEIESKIFWENQ